MNGSAAKRKITPEPNLLKDLRGKKDIIFSGVSDDIFVRVLLLDDGKNKILFVVFDLDIVPNPGNCLMTLSAATGIPEANITLASTQTQRAPVIGRQSTQKLGFGTRKARQAQNAAQEYAALLEQAAKDAALEAMERMQPVNIGWCQGESLIDINQIQDYFDEQAENIKPRVGAQQENPVPVERKLLVLKVEDCSGNMVACLTNYAVQSCLMHLCEKDQGILLSSGLGGNVSKKIEKNFPGCVALWTSGAARDVGCFLPAEMIGPDASVMLNVLATKYYADVLYNLKHISCDQKPMNVGGMDSWTYVAGKDGPHGFKAHLAKIGDVALWGFRGEVLSSAGKVFAQMLMLNDANFITSHEESLVANTGHIFDNETLMQASETMLLGDQNNEILPGLAKEALLKLVSKMWEQMN